MPNRDWTQVNTGSPTVNLSTSRPLSIASTRQSLASCIDTNQSPHASPPSASTPRPPILQLHHISASGLASVTWQHQVGRISAIHAKPGLHALHTRGSAHDLALACPSHFPCRPPVCLLPYKHQGALREADSDFTLASLMAPPSRFGGGPPAMAPPYQHQFPQHPATTHASHQQSSLSNPPFLTQQLSPFATNGLGLGGGMGAGSSFQVGDQTGFASQAARTGFQHAAALQQQQQHPHQQSHGQPGERAARTGGGGKGRIREVWRHNFEEEMVVLMGLAETFPYIAMVGLNPGVLRDMHLLTNLASRIPNFLALLGDQWGISGGRVTITTSAFASTSICSKSYK